MVDKVFISHKSTDTNQAEAVAKRVIASGMEVYLDSIDSALYKDGPDLADYLLRRMGECQQLIAVLSSSTKNSWWVPWEIGVGSEKGFRIASYADSYVQLPSYLQKWPVLKSLSDVDKYCQYSARTKPDLYGLSESRRTVAATLSTRKSNAAQFHKSLKTALNQR